MHDGTKKSFTEKLLNTSVEVHANELISFTNSKENYIMCIHINNVRNGLCYTLLIKV